jgi:hypothetical protein
LLDTATRRLWPLEGSHAHRVSGRCRSGAFAMLGRVDINPAICEHRGAAATE